MKQTLPSDTEHKHDLYIRLQAKTAIKAGLRRVFVDEIGRVRDPGPPKR